MTIVIAMTDLHAEMNAIVNATYFGNDIKGSVIYLTISPCVDCMKLLIQYGVSIVYYKKEYQDFEQAKFMAKHGNIKLIKM